MVEEGNVLFNDTLNTFYLRLYGVGHMVKDHSDSERGNLLLPHGLLFLISSKGSFICITHRQYSTYLHLCYTSRGALAGFQPVLYKWCNGQWQILHLNIIATLVNIKFK